jgi:transporter family protein
MNPFELSGRTGLFLVLSGLSTGASWTCCFRALTVSDASQMAPVDKLSVLLLVLFAVVFLGERPPAQERLGILRLGDGMMMFSFK